VNAAEVARLRQLPFLETLTDDLLAELAPNIEFERYEAGDRILRAGQYCDGAYYLSEGTVEIRLGGDTGASPRRDVARVRGGARPAPSPPADQPLVDDLTVVLSGETIAPGGRDGARLEAGDIFGEMSALSRYAVASDVIAESDVTCWLIGTAALRKMFDRPELAAFRDFFNTRYRERTLASVIRRVGLFRNVDERLLERLRQKADLVSFKPGREIVAQGARPDAFFLVRGGYIKVSTHTGGRDVAVIYLRKGDVAGDVPLVLGEPWPFSLVALEHVELVRIEKSDFLEVLTRYPTVADEIWQSAIARLKERGATLSNPLQAQYLQFAMDAGLIHGESVLLIDLTTCTRCDECVRGCADAHDGTPRFVREGGRFKNFAVPSACFQCVDPVCMVACPTGAISRPLGTLEVTINQDTCIGCGRCSERCPWDRIYNVPRDTGDARGHIDLATKCDLCVGRDDGPACVQMCPHGSAVRVNFKEFEATRRRLLGDQS
jgi:CRP-like cAMP-binding protein/Fe-S-cluster-containing hydrogenase component 2